MLALLAYLFGSYRSKIKYDTVLREYHAFGILQAADYANEAGFSAVSVIEFGVAAGFGLMNMAAIAAKVSKLTGVKVTVYGFDTGKGMPAPRDYRDHPDLYSEGDFPMDFEKLTQVLPPTQSWSFVDTDANDRGIYRGAFAGRADWVCGTGCGLLFLFQRCSAPVERAG